MPLNIEDGGREEPVKPEAPETLYQPRKPRRIYPWLLLIIVISSGVFLLFQFGIIAPGRRGAGTAPVPPAAGAPSEKPVSPDTAVHVRIPAENPPAAAGEKNAPAEPVEEGNYTIVISAFSTAADAEELAGRWTGAGFSAGVQHASGWYRVTLGRFHTVSDARAEAERLREALEVGYWITRINI